MPEPVKAAALEKRRKAAIRSRTGKDRHVYFQAVSQARYVLRKVFRIIEEHAKHARLDPLAHQAMIQIYGSASNCLRVKDVADRLDIAPAFASNLIKPLVEEGYVVRTRDGTDQREIRISLTEVGIALLHRIDDAVKLDVDHLTHKLPQAEKEQAVSILLFYVGMSLDPTTAPPTAPRPAAMKTSPPKPTTA